MLKLIIFTECTKYKDFSWKCELEGFPIILIALVHNLQSCFICPYRIAVILVYTCMCHDFKEHNKKIF